MLMDRILENILEENDDNEDADRSISTCYIIFLKACHVDQLLHEDLCKYVGLNRISLYAATKIFGFLHE